MLPSRIWELTQTLSLSALLMLSQLLPQRGLKVRKHLCWKYCPFSL